MTIYHIQLDEVRSTNSYLKALITDRPDLPSWTVVSTHNQSQGRGQRGNSWESEPGKNITLSILLHPNRYDGFEPFDLNIFVSLGLCSFLDEFIPSQRVKIKWPNDIYISEHKVAGILIENEWINADLSSSIVGIGLNINQKLFVSDAPNPTSIALETGNTYPLSDMSERLLLHLQEIYNQLPSHITELRENYHSRLFRRDGMTHVFRDMEGRRFEAEIIGVTPGGQLCLRHVEDLCTYQYAFKEVSFVL